MFFVAAATDPARTVKPPHVAESAFSMECALDHWHDLRNEAGVVTGHVILGRIKMFQTVCASLYDVTDMQKEFIFGPEDNMKVLPEKLRAVSRLGGVT
jgi:flavin reductase (DIM6/NTAB) family NADH-FMN oxidoreductase RutF